MKDLDVVMSRINRDELANLREILRAENASNSAIYSAFQWNSQNKVTYFFASDKSYYSIVKEVAKRLKVSFYDGEEVDKIEIRIMQKALKQIWEKLSDDDKKKLEEHLRDDFKRSGKEWGFFGSATAFAALTAAQLSGFGVYLLSSVVLSTVARTVGIGLPFAAYAGASSTISFLIGPVGWVLTAVIAIWTLTGPNSKRLLLAVIQIAAVRARMKEEG